MSAQEAQNDVEIEIVADQQVPDLLPVMPLKNFVLFPQMVAPLVITSDESKKLVTDLSTKTPHFITALLSVAWPCLNKTRATQQPTRVLRDLVRLQRRVLLLSMNS